jgi:quercetin dioxygenase-like cupin family protein
MIGAGVLSEDLEWVQTGPGTSRVVLVTRPELMLVAFRFDKGAVGPLHSHAHVQASYVAAGSFDVTVDGVTTTIHQGGTFIVAPWIVHGVMARESGLLIDSFSPCREDFL